MIRKYILPILAVVGVLFAIFMVRLGQKTPAVAQPVADPAKPPFENYVAGAGLVEAATENIQIGTPVAGVVTAVYRRVGDPLKAGLPHELVRRIAPLITAGSKDEAYDDMVLAARSTSGEASRTMPPVPSPGSGVPSVLSPASSPATSIPASNPGESTGGTANAARLAAPTSATQPVKINVNTASAAELVSIPGIDHTTAARIIAGRPYASIWDLEGTPLFKIDDRAARADLAVKRAAAEQARQKLAKLVRGYRDEEIRIARAQQEEAQAAYENARRLYERWSRVEDQAAVPPEELATRRSNMLEADARLRRTRANLEMLQAGVWEPDVQIARAELQSAEAQVRTAQTEIDRLTVRTQVDGTVLQVKVRPGEYAPSGVMATPLMLIGRTDILHIRTDIDEHEAMRVRPQARAVASIRGDSARQVALRCVYIEPYVIPKKSLTGDSSERVDTRVLQVIYAFDPKELHAYVGQQMDVFIDAAEVSSKQ